MGGNQKGPKPKSACGRPRKDPSGERRFIFRISVTPTEATKIREFLRGLRGEKA